MNTVPEFRWMNAKDSTAWYNSVRVIRQKNFGDWSDCMNQVRNLISCPQGYENCEASSSTWDPVYGVIPHVKLSM